MIPLDADILRTLIDNLITAGIDASQKWAITEAVVRGNRNPTHDEWVASGVSSEDAHRMLASYGTTPPAPGAGA